MKLALALLALSIQALAYFMMIAFAAPAVEVDRKLEAFLTASIYIMLGVCFGGAGVMIWAYVHEWKRVYEWALLPLPFAALFVVLRFKAF
ncbi:MAG: hypothetical protein E6Q99_08540 [Elusimicrobia bacterium]|nr:MAG: hypothetical protein E6Q99_08540 [Elusimicrobiota bacterium]